MIMDRQTLDQRVKVICDATTDMLNPTSDKYIAFIEEIDSVVQSQASTTSSVKNPIDALNGKEPDVQAKILINNNIVSFSAKLVPVFREQFTEISDDVEDSDLVPLLKGLIMKLEPFTPNVDTRIGQIVWTIQSTKTAKAPTIFGRLISLCLI